MAEKKATKNEKKNANNQPVCGAKKRDGSVCESPFINTENGKCKVHGGATGSGRPVVSGRYSKRIKSAKIGERYQEYLADPNLADLYEDLARLKAYRDEWFDLIDEAIDSGQQLSQLDRDELREWIEQISKVSERASKIRFGEKYSLTVEQSKAFAARVCDISQQLVSNYVPDDKQLEAQLWLTGELEKLG